MSTLEVRPDPGFVAARRDLNVTRNGIKSTIRAGAPVRADDEVVRERPEFFYRPVRHRFHVEVTGFEQGGRQLGVRSFDHEIEDAPLPETVEAVGIVERYWKNELSRQGYVMTLWAQRTGASEWAIKAEVEKEPNPNTPIVYVTVEPPRPRRAIAKRLSDGTMEVKYENE